MSVVGKLGLGLAALGRPGYINLGHDQDLAPGRGVDDLRRRTHQVLDFAWAAGIRYFDAARSYGLAERFLGEWLAAHPGRRPELTIGSKWGYTYVADWRLDVATHEVKDHSVATFERQWPETLEALGGPPDLYQIHSLTPESPALEDSALLDRLGELAAQGVRVGFSTSGPRQGEALAAALALGGPFTAVQATWNVLEPSAGAALEQAHDAGWLVAVKEVVANGRLTSRAGDTPFTRLAAARGVAPDALALAAAAAQPWVDIALSGATTTEQLQSNLAYAAIGRPDTADQAASSAEGFVSDGSLAQFAQDPTSYWADRSALPWI